MTDAISFRTPLVGDSLDNLVQSNPKRFPAVGLGHEFNLKYIRAIERIG